MSEGSDGSRLKRRVETRQSEENRASEQEDEGREEAAACTEPRETGGGGGGGERTVDGRDRRACESVHGRQTPCQTGRTRQGGSFTEHLAAAFCCKPGKVASCRPAQTPVAEGKNICTPEAVMFDKSKSRLHRATVMFHFKKKQKKTFLSVSSCLASDSVPAILPSLLILSWFFKIWL